MDTYDIGSPRTDSRVEISQSKVSAATWNGAATPHRNQSATVIYMRTSWVFPFCLPEACTSEVTLPTLIAGTGPAVEVIFTRRPSRMLLRNTLFMHPIGGKRHHPKAGYDHISG